MDFERQKQKELKESPELVVPEASTTIRPFFQAKYEILSELGTGGMGTVYKALDVSLNRFVAIKVLPERHCSDEQSILRFQQEARAAGALSHDGIVSMLYEALTGRVPHRGESALATAIMHLQQEALPLSAVQPDLHFPDGLQSVLNKALAKSASDRYRSMAEFKSDLQKLQSGTANQFAKIGVDDKRRRLLNSVRQRLSIFLGIVFLVSASFSSNLTVSGVLYLLGGLLLVFSIPGLRSDGPIAVAMQRQSRTIIPVSRTEMIAWIVFVPLLLGILYVWRNGGH